MRAVLQRHEMKPRHQRAVNSRVQWWASLEQNRSVHVPEQVPFLHKPLTVEGNAAVFQLESVSVLHEATP